MKTSSFDCALNYHRNYRDAVDYSRECDYNKCNYTCNGWVNTDDYESSVDKHVEPTQLDYSTYRIYYQDERVKLLSNIIIRLFKKYFTLSYMEIYNKCIIYGYTDFEILSSLIKIINSNVPIKNKYGFSNYIVNYGNYFFLANKIGIKTSILDQFYTKFPSSSKTITFKQFVIQKTTANIPQQIQRLCRLSNNDKLEQFIKFSK